MARKDYPGSYKELREIARAVNHDLRVIVAPGHIEPGQAFTLKPFEADALELGPALLRIREYLDSPEAARRGELYRRRDEAAAAEEAANRKWRRAMQARRDAVAAIQDDIVDELDRANPILTARDARRALTEIGTDDAQLAMMKLDGVPDDELVQLEAEDDGAGS